MYKLFTDINKNFTADVDVQGVPLSECQARIILETDNLNLLYKGTINENGKCEVDIKKLKGILNESDMGNLKLEIIADGTLFEAWNTDFIVDTKKKIAINEVKDVEPDKVVESPLKVKVNVNEENSTDFRKHINILENEISKRNIKTREQFDHLFNIYKNITQKRSILTESDISLIQKHLTSKHFN